MVVKKAIIDVEALEREIIAGIEKAREELRAGKGIPHDQAMKMIDAVIDKSGRAT